MIVGPLRLPPSLRPCRRDQRSKLDELRLREFKFLPVESLLLGCKHEWIVLDPSTPLRYAVVGKRVIGACCSRDDGMMPRTPLEFVLGFPHC